MSDSPHDLLLALFSDEGFSVPAERPSWLAAGEGFVEHLKLGIQIHVTAEMIRLCVPATDTEPEHRLILGRLGMRTITALRIIAVYVRAAIAERS